MDFMKIGAAIFGDKKITEEDFKYLVNELGAGNAGDEYISMAFQQMDSNGNGQLDLSEAMAGFGKIKEFVDSHRGDEVE